MWTHFHHIPAGRDSGGHASEVAFSLLNVQKIKLGQNGTHRQDKSTLKTVVPEMVHGGEE